jgi:putative chitinase
MPELTTETLVGIMPRIRNAPVWVAVLNEAAERFEINTTARLAAFLAQTAHESAELNRLTENLNYSAPGLVATWPKRFASVQLAQEYARNPEKIANFVYADRMGNGASATGDGWRYRGRGIIQLTGRGNYRSVGQALALDLETNPDLLVQPSAAALAAAFFWKSRGLNELADDRNEDDDEEDFVSITVAINGGRAGLTERKKYWEQAKAVLLA